MKVDHSARGMEGDGDRLCVEVVVLRSISNRQ